MPTHSSSAASSQHSGQYEIPRELQEVLLDFTVHYLIEQVWSLGRYFMSVSKVSHDQGERRQKMDKVCRTFDQIATLNPLKFEDLGGVTKNPLSGYIQF